MSMKRVRRWGRSLMRRLRKNKRDTFCVLAWNHLQIMPNGTAKMCCIARENLADNGRLMSLYTDKYEEIWNSDYMRSARRGMAEGEMISACKRCYREENAVGQSRRTVQNAEWLSRLGKTPDELIDEARGNAWSVRGRPGFLQLNMGNLCNLACRMCSSQYSSRIENDPVHSKWRPSTLPDVARWRGNRLHLGPRPCFGVIYHGFHEYRARRSLRWTKGVGVISFEIPSGTNLTRLGLSLRTVGWPKPVTIRLNGEKIFSGKIVGEWSREFDQLGLGKRRDLKLEIATAAAGLGSMQWGVALLDVWVERQLEAGVSATNARTLTRLSGNQGWWSDPEVMFEEILGEPETLRHIIFQGGEPFLVKEFDQILDVLIETGVAANVTFEIVSNMTTLKDSTIDNLGKLKKVLLGVSIDGIGDVLEYIRYPAKWTDIENNIRRVRRLGNLELGFNTAVQLYNLHHMLEILRYCDSHDFDVHTHFLVSPKYLSVLVLPPAARLIVLEQLHEYVAEEGHRPGNRKSAEYMITFLEEHADDHYRRGFGQFVQFTNDLDVSRGQSFRDAYPHLVEKFAEASQIWTDKTLGAVQRAG